MQREFPPRPAQSAAVAYHVRNGDGGEATLGTSFGHVHNAFGESGAQDPIGALLPGLSRLTSGLGHSGRFQPFPQYVPLAASCGRYWASGGSRSVLTKSAGVRQIAQQASANE